MREYEIWKQAVKLLDEVQFISNGETANLTLEWGNALEIIKEIESFNDALRNKDNETVNRLI